MKIQKDKLWHFLGAMLISWANQDVKNYDYVFTNIAGQTITLTIPSALMTCNGGNPDGDIQYLQANNTVTIIQT